MRVKLENVLSLRRSAAALTWLLLAAVCCVAQSSDLNYPTPVVANEIEGRVAPRDLGDPRLTSHFYTFNGTQGDITINIESLNLDGAVDLFLSPALRPLTQFTLIATGSALNVSKSVFLRKEESIVLRVQARTPNDTDGTYRIRLGGTFQPATNVAAEPPQPEAVAANKPVARPTAKGVHRVNAVGARIEEPEPVEAAPAAATEEEKRAEESHKREPARTARTPTPRTGTTRRTRTPTRTDTARSGKPAPARKTETRTTEPEQPAGTETPEPAPAKAEPARTPRTRAGRTTRNTRGGETARRTREPAKQPTEGTPAETSGANEPPAPTIVATRLVIEVRDGARVEHEMSTVNRVTVVGGLIVVILKNGHIERYPLTNVLRMAIEP